MSDKTKGIMMIVVWLFGWFVTFGALRYYSLESAYLDGDIPEYEKLITWGYTPGLITLSFGWPATALGFALSTLYEGASPDYHLRIGFTLSENIMYPKHHPPKPYMPL